MANSVDEWAHLQWSQDDLHATGAFGHHLFSTFLCNTQRSKSIRNMKVNMHLWTTSHTSVVRPVLGTAGCPAHSKLGGAWKTSHKCMQATVLHYLYLLHQQNTLLHCLKVSACKLCHSPLANCPQHVKQVKSSCYSLFCLSVLSLFHHLLISLNHIQHLPLNLGGDRFLTSLKRSQWVVLSCPVMSWNKCNLSKHKHRYWKRYWILNHPFQNDFLRPTARFIEDKRSKLFLKEKNLSGEIQTHKT